jgi:hypothetical protein
LAFGAFVSLCLLSFGFCCFRFRSTTRKLYDPHHLYPPRSDVHGGRGGYLPDDDVDENLEVEFTLMQVNQVRSHSCHVSSRSENDILKVTIAK